MEIPLKLKEAVATKQPRKYESIIDEIEKYRLSSEDEELFDKIKTLIERYRFKELKDKRIPIDKL